MAACKFYNGTPSRKFRSLATSIIGIKRNVCFDYHDWKICQRETETFSNSLIPFSWIILSIMSVIIHASCYASWTLKGWRQGDTNITIKWLKSGNLISRARTLSLLGEVDMGMGSCLTKKSWFSGPKRKLLPALSDFKKTIALAFLKTTSPQISNWVCFTFKGQNPIYMFTFIEYISNWLGFYFWSETINETCY